MENQNLASVDRLSNLEDALLYRILSFVPTKLSVSTSILAKRWRFIWTHVPILDFYGLHIHFYGPTRFPSIINKVMLPHRMRTINTLRLWATNDCNDSEFETWIATAIERKVENLELRAPVGICVWPLPLFNCKTLVHLKLIGCALTCFNAHVSLPSLKKLWFEQVEFSVDEALPLLLAGCPVLDELIFDGLNLGDCFFMSCWVEIRRLTAYDYSRSVEIKVVELKENEVVDCVLSHIPDRMLTSLVEANIEIRDYMDIKTEQCFIPMLLRLLDRLCNVKHLKFSLPMVFSSGIQSMARFDNCARLELAVDWPFLVKFLESADNLQVLIIRNISCYYRVRAFSRNWNVPKQVPTCLLSCLRTVRIEEFECTEPEFELVRYILMNAKVLKRMEIHITSVFDVFDRLDAAVRATLFRRGSEACELAFC